MWHCALALLLLATPAERAQPGTVRGEVRITTVAPDGSRKVKADRSDVVVYIPDFQESLPPGPPVEMRQQDKAFVPSVLPIHVGQTVDFFNADPLLHNVFSNSRAARFDLGKFKGHSKAVQFTEPGVVDVYCDIHESMVGTIFVLPNHAFARTGPDGRFELRGVPPGKHTVYAWLRDASPVTAEVNAAPGQAAMLTLSLEEHPVAKPHHKNKYGEDYKPHSAGYDR